MKKKNLLLSIFFSLLLIFSAHTFNSNKTASAAIDQDIVYTVSTADGKYNVTSTTSLDDNTNVTTHATALDTLELAFTTIQTHATEQAQNEVVIVFEDITLSNDMVVPFQKAKFSGTINLGSYSILLTTSTTENILSFEDLTLNATGDQSLVKVVKGTFADDEIEKRYTLNLTNVKFNSTSTAENYAVYFETGETIFNVYKKLVHQTKYFFNYLESVNITISNNLDLTEQPSGKISIPVPLSLDGEILIKSFLPGDAGNTYLNLVPMNSYYTCEPGDVISNRLFVKCKINAEFLADEGELSADYKPGLDYKSTTEIPFPTAEEMTKENNTLKGYFGVVETADETYYFDKAAILSLPQQVSMKVLLLTISSQKINMTNLTNTLILHLTNTTQLKQTQAISQLNTLSLKAKAQHLLPFGSQPFTL